jgi:hypothetical protein
VQLAAAQGQQRAARTFLTWKRGGLAGAGAESTSMADMTVCVLQGRVMRVSAGGRAGGDEERKQQQARDVCARLRMGRNTARG